jgi:hypothetical protein
MAEVAVTLVKVPHAGPPHPGPEALQVTPLFPVSFVRLVVKARVCPWSMLGGMAGLTVTEMSETVEGVLLLQPHINNKVGSK